MCNFGVPLGSDTTNKFPEYAILLPNEGPAVSHAEVKGNVLPVSSS